MVESYRGEKKNIGELLSESSRLVVSLNQRKFSWDLSQIEIFWQDIMSFWERNAGEAYRTQEYFIGSIVIIDVPGKLESQILDGQQRLATATILLAVIRDILIKFGFTESAVTLQDRYIMSHDELQDSDFYHLVLSRYDQEFFCREIQKRRDIAGYIEPTPQFSSHRFIRTARNFFLENIQLNLNNITAENDKKKWLLRLKEILTKCITVIRISSEDKDSAAIVFETLNDRGIGLSAPDLLRNFMLDEATSDIDRELISQNWEDILNLEEKNAHAEDFLRHFWLSRYGDIKTRSLYREIKSRMTIDNISSMALSRELSDEAEIYESIITADHDDPEIKHLLKGIALMGASALLPATLSALIVGDLNKQKSLLKYLVILYIRHTIIGGLENSKLEQLVFGIARDIRNTKNFKIAEESIRVFAPSDKDFLDNLETATVSRSGAARFILREIEMKKRGPQTEIAVEDIPVVNLEHIYPQNPSFTRWNNHDEIVNRIGNLTLLRQRINRNLKSSEFAAKKVTYATSDLFITKELDVLNSWSLAELEKRQKKFAKIAAIIWQF